MNDVFKPNLSIQTLSTELLFDRLRSGCGIVTRSDGTKFAMVGGGAYIGSYESTEILDLETLEVQTGEV